MMISNVSRGRWGSARDQSLTGLLALALVWVVGGVPLRGQSTTAPAAGDKHECLSAKYAAVVAAAKEAARKEADDAKDARAPAPGTTTADYESEAEEADRIVKAWTREHQKKAAIVTNAQEKIAALQKQLTSTPEQREQSVKAARKDLNDAREKSEAADALNAAYAKDPEVISATEKVNTQQTALSTAVSAYMPPETKNEDVLTRINDVSFRSLDPSTVKGAGVTDEFVKMTQKLLAYKNFNTPDGRQYRTKVEEAVVAMRALRVDGNPYDDIRKNAPLLIKEIEKARAAVDSANQAVSAAQQAVTDRKLAMITPGKGEKKEDILALANDPAAVKSNVKKLEQELKDLESASKSDEKARAQLNEEQKRLSTAQQDVKTALDRISGSNVDLAQKKARLKQIQEYDKIHHPLEVARKNADDAVIAIKGQLDKQKEDLAKSKKDFDDIDKDLADFDARKKGKVAEIRTQAQGAPAEKATARQRYDKLITVVKAKNDDSTGKLKAVQGLLEPHRQCYSDLDDVLNRITVRLTTLASADADLDDLGKLLAVAVAITAPADGTKSKQADITITGTVTDAQVSQVTISIGGKSVTAAVKGGQFSASATLAQGQNVIEASVGSSRSNPITVTLGDASPWDGLWRGTIRGVSVHDGVRKTSEHAGDMQVAQNGDTITLKTGKNNLQLKIDPDSPNSASKVEIQTFAATDTSREGRSKRTMTATLRDGQIHMKVVFEMNSYTRPNAQASWREMQDTGESNGQFERVK
jgi:hypothetical protein